MNQRNHRPDEYRGRSLALDIISRVTDDGGYSNILSAKLLSKPGVSREDAAAAVNIVYGVLRNILLIDEILVSKTSKGKLNLPPRLKNIARMACFEILFMDSIPGFATVSEHVEMAKKEGSRNEAGFINACLRKISIEDIDARLKTRNTDAKKTALRYSHPEWMIEELFERFGAETAVAIAGASNSPQPAYYRLNASRMTEADFLNLPQNDGTAFIAPGAPPFCVSSAAGGGPFPAALYANGILSPQDRSAQIAAHFLAPAEGERILDLCCGSGTKTAQIAELTKGGARIVGIDNMKNKLKSLATDASRLGFKTVPFEVGSVSDTGAIQTLEADASDITVAIGLFDRVLLDAPCSGSGVFRRRPELRMRISEKSIFELMRLQDRLLDSAARHVAPGGTLVYSTCSILARENEDRIKSFLERNRNFEPSAAPPNGNSDSFPAHLSASEYGTLYSPHQLDSCGSFASVLQKTK